MTVRNLWHLIRDTSRHWSEDKASVLGAALAYYALFSVAPLVLTAVSIAGLVFGEDAAREEIVRQITASAGEQVGRAVGDTLAYVHNGGSGTYATVISLAILTFAATGIFAQLQDALNTVWGVQARSGRGVLGVIKDRFWSFMLVVVFGVLLLASLVVMAGLTGLTHLLPPDAAPARPLLWQTVNWLVSIVLLTALIAMVYKLLPDVQLHWSDVGTGAVVTALLVTIGNQLIGLYLGWSSWISAYGAAGSLVVVVLWVYYSAQVFLFGAEFTQVYATRAGKRLPPKANAEPVTAEARARQGRAPGP
ncbi:MAG TPA: YihY/virulence factor BrkB family protein, partial [Gemmataceae bacterium]